VPGNPVVPADGGGELFVTEAYCRSFDADVVELDREQGRVALARTAFYPRWRGPAARPG